jgi:DNA-3-methyladenine glycosylase II
VYDKGLPGEGWLSKPSMAAAPHNAPSVPDYWPRAKRELTRVDPALGRLIRAYPGLALQSRGEPFVTLVRSIVGQQISVKAADAVWGRLQVAVPTMSPRTILAAPEPSLRAAGLSVRKSEYVRHLAERFQSRHIRPERWHGMSDEAVTEELVTTRGIGNWTAEMLLIFNLMRPDVCPLDDIGLQKAVALHFCAGERPGRADLRAIGERWRPWRSVATWYLWRSLDPVPVEY